MTDDQQPPAAAQQQPPAAGAGQPAPAGPHAPRKTSGLAITAFVLACLFILPLVPVIGSVLGIIALVRLADRPQLGGKGLAIAAIPTGLVVTLFLQGMMAAIAIPAFIKYIRKSKSVEATEGLDKLVAGARSYAQADHYDTSGRLLPRGFPQARTGWVPASPCCAQPGGPKCQPRPAEWQTSPWTELFFSMDTPHYFQWRYSGGGRAFTVEARADLDCDGEYSSYTVSGVLTDSGTVQTRGPVISDGLE